MKYPLPKFRTLLWRGLRRKCPQCGEGPLYKRWIKFHDNCPVCGLRYLPNQGDLWGPLLFLDRLLFIIPLIVLIYFRVWHTSGLWICLFGGGMMFVLVVTLPHRNGMSLAVDYFIRRKIGDLSDEANPRED